MSFLPPTPPRAGDQIEAEMRREKERELARNAERYAELHGSDADRGGFKGAVRRALGRLRWAKDRR